MRKIKVKIEESSGNPATVVKAIAITKGCVGRYKGLKYLTCTYRDGNSVDPERPETIIFDLLDVSNDCKCSVQYYLTLVEGRYQVQPVMLSVPQAKQILVATNLIYFFKDLMKKITTL